MLNCRCFVIMRVPQRNNRNSNRSLQFQRLRCFHSLDIEKNRVDKKNDSISTFDSIVSYFFITLIPFIRYIYNSIMMTFSHNQSIFYQSPLLYNSIHNSYSISIPYQCLLRKSLFSLNGWGCKIIHLISHDNLYSFGPPGSH